MTNHNPSITSSNATGSFSENSNTTGSNALHQLSGTMNFNDSDRRDSHTTSASLKSAVLSSGSVIPASTLAHLNSAMSSIILSDSNGSGKLKWSFSAEDDDFDFLAKNQSLVLTYEIKLSDNHGGTTKKTVTITVTGTDDKPIIDFGTEAVVQERAGVSLSFAADTAQMAVHFVDPDLTNTGHTASVTDVSASGATGGLLPGILGELELMSFFRINNVVKASGSSNGTINATFSAPDLAFDYLSAGEALDITYTIKLNDNAGGITTQTVVVTVIGSNDGPVILAFPESRNLTEGGDLSPAGDLTACGDFHFADIDLSDTHTVSIAVTAERSGGGTVPLSNADLVAALSTSLDDSDGHVFGEVDWNFSLDNDAVSFLHSGETLTLTYQITVTDSAGGSDTQTVTVMILGVNDPVVITSGPGSASLAEFADTSGSAAANTTSPVPTGTLSFTDTDIGDTHTLGVTIASATWSGGSGVPAATSTALAAALLTTLNDSTGTGSGSIDWTFSIADQELDFLAAGETLTVDYDVSIADGSTNDSETVTITVTGANDLVAITSGPGAASLEEMPNTTGSSAPNTTSPVPTGTLSFIDADFTDTHVVSVSVASAVWSVDPFFLPEQTQADLLTALVTTLSDSTGTGAGSVDWTFSIPDQDLDFLGAGETLTVTYDVTVADAFSSATQQVTITITGAQDALVVNPLVVAAADTPFVDLGSVVAAGNLIFDAGDNAGDAGVSLSITEVNGQPVSVGQFAGAYGDLLVTSDGFYIYIANASLDPLQEGDTATEQFDFVVTDSLGRSEATTLTLNVSGANDAPVITGAIATGSVTEDLGPTLTVNGDFETGDFSGWDTTDSHAQIQFGGLSGQYVAQLPPMPFAETLVQNIATTPGQQYKVSFFVSGDPESTGNSLTVAWNGVTVLAVSDNYSGALTRYSFDVVGGPAATSSLEFTYFSDGLGMLLDDVALASVPGPATASTDGSITFADIETADTHTATFVPQGVDYVGTFSLGPVSETSGSGSLAWNFTVNNADIQFLAEGETLFQTYTVFLTDDHGASGLQDITITLIGSNDAPAAAVADTIITNAGEEGGLFIPAWALVANDVDPDLADTLDLHAVLGSTGGSAFEFGGVIFFDDASLGGAFSYNTTDGLAVGGAGTATVINNSAASTVLTGTDDDEIIIATVGGEALDGGGGDDILIGNSGSHDLTGGSGDDIFAFQVVPDGLNKILDFDNTVDNDMIAISSAAFGAGLTAGMDLSPVFESTADAEFLGALFHYDTSSQRLYFSADGTTASAVVVAQLQAGAVLHANDLLIV